MNFSKLTLAIATTLAASASFNALAMDLYVDTKTKQIYAEPGRGRVLMGAFEKVDEARGSTAAPVADAAEIAAIREDLALKTNEIKALSEHAEEASAPDSVKVELKDGIEFKTKDGNFKAAINGRLQVDSQVNVNDQFGNANAGAGAATNNLSDGVGLRRARLGVEGTFYKNTDYKFEYDFTRGNGTIGAGVTDAFIRYNFSKPFSVKFGAFKEPFSLEEATSNRYITFIERNSITNTFVDNLNTYKLGIGANYSADRWQVATSLQTEPVGANGASNSSVNSNGGSNRNGGSGDTNWEVNLRASGTPWFESKTKFLHVGTSGSYINVNNNYTNGGAFNNGSISFVANPATNVDRTNTLSTGSLTSGSRFGRNSLIASDVYRFGAETALVYGPWSVQGEYIATFIDGKGYNGEKLDGYYGYVTYFLTGESRNYKSKTGAWDRIKPNHNFDLKGGWGAWEVAAGYDAIDLNDGVIQGGRQSTAKLGINWFPHSHVRISANYVKVLDINSGNALSAPGGGGTITGAGATNTPDLRARAFNNSDFDIIETRVQLDF